MGAGLRMTREAISDFAAGFAQKQAARHPTFSLFRRACDAFVQSVQTAPSSYGDPSYVMMSELDVFFRGLSGDSARWGRIFISLWFCNNFAAALWRDLLRSDSTAAPCAVEHCFHVLCMSGADGSPQLAELLNEAGAWGGVEPKLAEVAGLRPWSEDWVQRLLSFRK